jgi:Immunity protein 41
MDAIEILNANYSGIQGSFIYFLHEESKFHKESFWDYYICLVELSRQSISNGIDNEIAYKIIFTYGYILESIAHHFDPNDLYKIKYFPRKKYNLYLERLRFAMDGYFLGRIYEEDIFELNNPN